MQEHTVFRYTFAMHIMESEEIQVAFEQVFFEQVIFEPFKETSILASSIKHVLILCKTNNNIRSLPTKLEPSVTQMRFRVFFYGCVWIL